MPNANILNNKKVIKLLELWQRYEKLPSQIQQQISITKRGTRNYYSDLDIFMYRRKQTLYSL